MYAVDKLIATALDEVGYTGKLNCNYDLYSKTDGPPGKFNKYAFELDALKDFYNGKKNGFDWCDVFVDWCFVDTFGRDLGQKMLYQPNRSLGAGTKYSMGYYTANKAFTSYPQIGSQIFFGDSKSVWHTGIVVEIKGSIIRTIEGNAGNPSAVRKCLYNIQNAKNILGYGIPNYELAKEETKVNTVPSTWAKDAVEWAIKNGISDGTELKETTTREQTITMLYRMFNLIKEDLK